MSITSKNNPFENENPNKRQSKEVNNNLSQSSSNIDYSDNSSNSASKPNPFKSAKDQFKAEVIILFLIL